MSTEPFEGTWEKTAKAAKQDADYEAEKMRTYVIYCAFYAQAQAVANILRDRQSYLPPPDGNYVQGQEIVRPMIGALTSVNVLCNHLSEYARDMQKQLDVLTAIEVERKLRSSQ